ncbi:MAG TPA: DUF3189 family protein [Bacillota bacterium]|nr:DUF3189 family protein [Bacillota bacterium]
MFPLAALAGTIHTGRLMAGEKPDKNIWSQPFLNIKKNDPGKVLSLGKDARGNDVYALSVKGERGMVYRLVESFLNMYGIGENELSFVDSGAGDSFFLLAGLYCCRFPLLVPLGRYLISTGLKKHYGRLSQLTVDVQSRLVNLP